MYDLVHDIAEGTFYAFCYRWVLINFVDKSRKYLAYIDPGGFQENSDYFLVEKYSSLCPIWIFYMRSLCTWIFQSLMLIICFGKIVNICFLCVNIFTNALEKDWEKNISRADWLCTYLDRTSTSVSKIWLLRWLNGFFKGYLWRVEWPLNFYSMKHFC